MITLVINDVTIVLHNVERLKKYDVNYYPINEYYGWPVSSWEVGDVLTIAGHGEGWKTGRIDPAVPQGWYEHYKIKHGEYPNAMWTYEPREDGTPEIFGRPLFVKDVWDEWLVNVRAALKESANAND